MTKIIDSLYIHFPFCLHLCNYCDFYKKKSEGSHTDIESFHQFIIKNFERHEKLTKEFGYSFVPLKTVYIGGGTPSLWGERGAVFLKDFLRARGLTLAPDCEFTMEVNPKAWTAASIDAFLSIGVNRFSIGVQTLNQDIIPFLDRYHNIDDIFETLRHFSDLKANYSIDFMLGLPHSTLKKRDITAELKQALKYNPQHFSVYILTVKDNYRHYSHLPDEDWIHDEFMQTSEILKHHGFDHYEVSNFAQLGKQSQHNLNYWKSATVAALGASATGFLNPDRLRYKWKTQDSEIEIEHLTEKEFFLEQVYMNLRSQHGISKDDFKGQGNDKELAFEKIISQWRKNNLIRPADRSTYNRVVLNSKGFLILDSLMGDLYALID